jgi:hypothetical protein
MKLKKIKKKDGKKEKAIKRTLFLYPKRQN